MMRSNTLITLIAALLLIISTASRASLIDNSDWTTDDVSNLDWLDLSFTAGMDYTTVINTFSDWKIATKDQFLDLYNQFDIDGDSLFADNSHISVFNMGISCGICIGIDRFEYDTYSALMRTDFYQLFGASNEIINYSNLGYGWEAYYSMGWYIVAGAK